MKLAKRNIKENRIIDAAEIVFTAVGFKNAKMEDIAQGAGITKVTLYSYFQSKDNLYMAITYRAFRLLQEECNKVTRQYEKSSGLETTIALMNAFMDFCEHNFLYSETLLEYYAMMRSSANGVNNKLTDALRESHYYRKMKDIWVMPIKIVVEAINKGKEDGSIKHQKGATFLTIFAWTMLTGYARMVAATGSNKTLLFDIQLQDLKDYHIAIVRDQLTKE